MSGTPNAFYFGTPLPPADIGAEQPKTTPMKAGVNGGSIPFAETGKYESEQVARLLLLMSSQEKDPEEWTAIPHQMLFAIFTYGCTGDFPKPPLPKLVVRDAAEDGTVETFVLGENNPAYYSGVFTRGVEHLVDEGFALAARHEGEDYIVPTERLIKAIR